MDVVLEQLVAKARDASHGGFGLLSTGEKLATALVLNRADWLSAMGYTMADAIRRIEGDWLAAVPVAARIIEDEAGP